MRRALMTMLAVAVALTAVAVGQDLPSPEARAVVEALLKRSRELEDVRFCVPQALWKQYLREQMGGPAPASPGVPVPWIAEAGEYRLSVAQQGKGVLEATVRIRIFDALAENKLAVLSAARAWKNLTLASGGGEAVPVELPALDGFLRFSPPAAGVYVFKAQTDVKGDRVALDIPPTVRTLFAFASGPGLEGRLEGRDDVIPAVAGQPTAGTMALAACKSLVMSYGPPPVAFERAPRYQLQGTVAWTLDADVQHVSADLGVDVLVGRSDRIDLALPEGADRVKITGPEVRDVQGASVFLRGRLRGQVRLNVEFDLRYGPGASRTLTGLGLREGRWTGGTLLVAGGGGDDEILPERAEGLTERTLTDLPAQARAMLRGQPVAAYGITGSNWSASVEALKLGQFAMRESIADLAHYQVALQPDGAMMCKAEYEVRNRSQQFLRVALPPGATVLLARVNEKAQPLVPLPERPGVFVLPLVRSDATVKGLVTFPVELVYLVRTPPLAGRGTARLPLPTLDIPVAYAWGEAYLPEGLAVTRWGGPMQQVEQFSSETAVASIGYGAGELAAGYKAEGRIHADAAGKKPEPSKAAGRTGTPGWFGDRTEKGVGRGWGPSNMVAQAPPPSGKPGRTPDEKAKVAGTVGGKGEGKGEGKGKGKEGGDKDAYAFTLGKNYWRTGQEYYQQGNYESAEKALRKVTELAPGSQEGANAAKLLSNLDVVRGQAKLTGAQEKAAGKGVQQEAAQQRQGLAQKQSEQLAKGFDALKAGKRAEAQVQFQAAQAYNTKLLEQGETAKEQDVLLAEARKEMQATAAAEQTKARELIDQAKQLSGKKEYSQALNLAKSARQRLKANEFGIDAKSNASISGDAQQATELVEQLTLATAQDAEAPEKSSPQGGWVTKMTGGAAPGVSEQMASEEPRRVALLDAAGAEERTRTLSGSTSLSIRGGSVDRQRTTGLSVQMEESLEEATDDWAAMTQRAKGPAPNASTDKPSAPYVYVYRGTGTAGAVATPPPPPSAPAQAKIPIVGDELKNPATTFKDIDGNEVHPFGRKTAMVAPRQPPARPLETASPQPSGETSPDGGFHYKAESPRVQFKVGAGVAGPSDLVPKQPDRQSNRPEVVDGTFGDDVQADFLADSTREKAVKREGGAIRGATRGHEDAIREVDPSARLGEAPPAEGRRRAALEQARRNRLGELTGRARALLADNATETAAGVLAEILRLDPQNAWAGDALARARRELRERIRPEPSAAGVPDLGNMPVVARLFTDGQAAPKADPIVERAYDIRDMLVNVPNFIGQRVDAAMHDQSVQGTDFFGDSADLAQLASDVPEQRRKAAEKVAQTIQSAVDPGSWRELERAVGGAIQISNGQLIVRQREDNQKKIANLLGQLREARGARVQEGEKLLTQIANETGARTYLLNQQVEWKERSVANQSGSGTGFFATSTGTDRTHFDMNDVASFEGNGPGEALANDPEFRKFVEDNYAWANDRNGRAGQTPASQPATLAYDNNDLAQRLLTNKGQKTNVTSWNVKVDERAAARVGLKFNVGNNDVRYTVVDEAQLRTLAELEASRGAAAAAVARNPQRQDTIVGTDAMLSNGMTANASFAADRGNVLDVGENPIALAHDRYLLVSNGEYLTAVRSQPMANWKQASAYVEVIEAPQKIEIPRVGLPVRFEKKLAGADETLDLSVTYEWKGAHP